MCDVPLVPSREREEGRRFWVFLIKLKKKKKLSLEYIYIMYHFRTSNSLKLTRLKLLIFRMYIIKLLKDNYIDYILQWIYQIDNDNNYIIA